MGLYEYPGHRDDKINTDDETESAKCEQRAIMLSVLGYPNPQIVLNHPERTSCITPKLKTDCALRLKIDKLSWNLVWRKISVFNFGQ